MPRAFRTDESLQSETHTRELIPAFLESVGCSSVVDSRKKTGSAISQTIAATLPNSLHIRAKVKLCWRRIGKSPGKAPYAATQLIAKVKPGTAETMVRSFAKKAIDGGLDHLLIVQADANLIEFAALIPFPVLGDIWVAQRNLSAKMIAGGKLGKRKKNHAENGHSPTLYLDDSAAPDIAALLWNHPKVVDLKAIVASTQHDSEVPLNDTHQDIVFINYEHLGSDSPPMVYGQMSHVVRDDKVRRAVLKRAGGHCERPGCGVSRTYPGFFDVHHILGVEKSDRVWNCVALCPTCHREAHVSPQAAAINKELLTIAMKSK